MSSSEELLPSRNETTSAPGADPSGSERAQGPPAQGPGGAGPVVFIPFAGSLHGVKRATIAAALISSPYPVRIGYDVDAIDCGTLAELENMTAAWGSDAAVLGLSNQLLTFRFGEKIGKHHMDTFIETNCLHMFQHILALNNKIVNLQLI